MLAEDLMAERLFGGLPQPEGATLLGEKGTKPAPEQSTAEQASQALYAKEIKDDSLAPVAADIAEIRSTPERRMYSAQSTLRDAIPDQEFANVKGLDDKVGQAAVRELREMAADFDFGTNEIRTLRDRAAFVAKSAPTTEAQREAAVEALNREFGQRATQALRDARALLQRDPRAANLIEAMGLGDDPEVVVLVAKAAQSQRMAGKLKGR